METISTSTIVNPPPHKIQSLPKLHGNELNPEDSMLKDEFEDREWRLKMCII